MTTKDVIKLLQIDETLKMELLNTYDFMDPAQKLQVDDTVWSTYDMFYEEKTKVNLQLLELEVKDGKRAITGDFYALAIKKTDEELDKQMQQANADLDLAAAKRAMEQIVKEIRASKKAKSTH